MNGWVDDGGWGFLSCPEFRGAFFGSLLGICSFLRSKQLPGTPRPTIYKWLFQLDDEPNLYLGNGCFTKHPLENCCLGFQVCFCAFFRIALARRQLWISPVFKPSIFGGLVPPSVVGKRTQSMGQINWNHQLEIVSWGSLNDTFCTWKARIPGHHLYLISPVGGCSPTKVLS